MWRRATESLFTAVVLISLSTDVPAKRPADRWPTTHSAKVPSAGFFGIQVIDQATGRGVPRVKLTTTTNEVWITDSGGQAAVLTTAFEGLSTFFSLESDGYEYAADAFGYRGTSFVVKAGDNATIALTRTQKAERLYRLTGQGIYKDSVLLDAPVPIAEPLLNAGVQGQDSILTVLFGGRVHWFWGDTGKLGFPLGNFQSTGATSCAPASLDTNSSGCISSLSEKCGSDKNDVFACAECAGRSATILHHAGCDNDFIATWCAGAAQTAKNTQRADNSLSPCLPVEKGINLQYYTTGSGADTFVKGMAALPPQPHPTWLGGLAVVPRQDAPAADSGSAMVASYMKAGPDMETIGKGMVIWDSKQQNFSLLANWSATNTHVAAGCCGQAVTLGPDAKHTTVQMQGTEYVVYTSRNTWPLATLRCKATVEELADHSNYEGWTPLAYGSTASAPKAARTASGQLDWQWRKGLAPMTATELMQLAKQGVISDAEAAVATAYDQETGLPLEVAGGSTHWHEGRKKWISVFGARRIDPKGVGDKESLLGEIYFSEARSLPGLNAEAGGSVWANATKIATHNQSGYSCYNPLQHSFYSAASRIYFSCTFVNTFSGVKEKEALYDYNNMMFSLDLDLMD